MRMSYAEKKGLAEVIQTLSPSQIGKVVAFLTEKCEGALVAPNDTDLQIVVDFVGRKTYFELME